MIAAGAARGATDGAAQSPPYAALARACSDSKRE
jgi:hypothetical protein